MKKIPWQRSEHIILAPHARLQPIATGRSRRQELEAASHGTPMIKSRERMNVVMLSTQLAFSTFVQPRVPWEIMLPTSRLGILRSINALETNFQTCPPANLISTIPPRFFFQVILDAVKLTATTSIP